jgi:hypothetical protein
MLFTMPEEGTADRPDADLCNDHPPMATLHSFAVTGPY